MKLFNYISEEYQLTPEEKQFIDNISTKEKPTSCFYLKVMDIYSFTNLEENEQKNIILIYPKSMDTSNLLVKKDSNVCITDNIYEIDKKVIEIMYNKIPVETNNNEYSYKGVTLFGSKPLCSNQLNKVDDLIHKYSSMLS